MLSLAVPPEQFASLRIQRLGLAEYGPIYDAMRRFTGTRNENTADELWLVQHPPVYTVGIAGRTEHFPRESDLVHSRSNASTVAARSPTTVPARRSSTRCSISRVETFRYARSCAGSSRR